MTIVRTFYWSFSKHPFDITNLYETCNGSLPTESLNWRLRLKYVVLPSEIFPDSAAGPHSTSVLPLQRWSSEWEAFVDVNSSVDLSNCDWLNKCPVCLGSGTLLRMVKAP